MLLTSTNSPGFPRVLPNFHLWRLFLPVNQAGHLTHTRRVSLSRRCGKNIFGLLGHITHSADQTILTDTNTQTIAPVSHFRKGFIEQQELSYALSALLQLGQRSLRSLPRLLCQSFDMSYRHLSGINKLDQDLSSLHRQPQLEATQGDQPIDLLPLGPTRLNLTGSLGRDEFITTLFAAPALEQHFLNPQPTHRQHQHPVQNPMPAILPDFSTTFWTGGRLFGLTRYLGNIDLLEGNPDRFDFFVYQTYPIRYGVLVKLVFGKVTISTTGGPFLKFNPQIFCGCHSTGNHPNLLQF